MHSTPPSLLERLRRPNPGPAWQTFVELYTPLLCEWTKRWGLQEADSADLVQDVVLLLYRKLPEFRYEANGSFRGWLRTVLLNKWREGLRRPNPVFGGEELECLAQPDDESEREELQYRQQLLRVLLTKIQPEFSTSIWRAFQGYVLDGESVGAVAERCQLSVATVYAAKSKVLSRVRQELAGLLD